MSFASLGRRRGAGRRGYLSLPGGSGNYSSAAYASALALTGDIDLRAQVALADWTPAANNTLIGKSGGAGARGWQLIVAATTGKLSAFCSTDGTNLPTWTSSDATGVADGATKWARLTREASTGTVKFYLSDDGSTWAQLGTDVAGTAGNPYNNSRIIEIGSTQTGTSGVATGHFYHVQIRSNILDDGSGIVLNANLTNTGRAFNEPASGVTVTAHGTVVASLYP